MVSPSIENPGLRAAARHKFEGIFFMHEVEVGSPAMARPFLEKLRENRPFAMDFWGLVDSLGRFYENVSDSDLREIVVNSVCGEWIPKDDPFFVELEHEFRTHRAALPQRDPTGVEATGNSVAGVAEVAGSDAASRKVSRTPTVQSEEASSARSADASLLAPSSNEPIKAAAPTASEEWPRPFGDDVVERDQNVLAFPAILAASEERERRRIDSAISKLELNSVAMRLYLDSIDSRMNRLEPHVEDLATRVVKSSWATAVDGQTPHPLTDEDSIALAKHFAASSGVIDSSPTPPLPLQEDPKPEEITAEPAVVDEVPLTEAAVPLRKRRQPSEAAVQALKSGVSTGMVVALLLILVCGLLGIGIWHSGGSIESRATTSIVAPGSADGTPTGAAIAGDTANKNTSTPVASTGLANRSVSGKSRVANSSVPLSNNLSSIGTAPTAASGSASAATGSSAPAVSTPTATSDAISENETAHSRESIAGGSGKTRLDSSLPGNGLRQVRVSSGVMASNLVRSSPPDYPLLARLTHQQGPVVMQVFISNRGTVVHVNVVKGHHILRGAAVSAVRSWKYRPYYVNGHPVEVATMVTVEFKLGR